MITPTKRKTLALAIALVATTFILSCKDNEPPASGGDQSKPSALFGETEKGAPLTSGTINQFTFASADDEVALILSNDASGKVFAIKLPDDSDPSKADYNTVSQSLPEFGLNIASAIGVKLNELRLFDMQLNPITKSIYILVGSTVSSDRSLLKVTNKGSQIEEVDLSEVEYVEVSFGNAGDRSFDLAWGDKALYVSSAVPSTLDGSVMEIETPFSSGSTVSSRSTTVFKTNWGGGFHTDAPLETMAFVSINNVGRLAGVTTCAPGFSFPVDQIDNASELLQINEYYNLNTRTPLKVFGAKKDGKTYLIEFHSTGRLTRIGEKYIDGNIADYNAQAKRILVNQGTERASGLTDEDVAIIGDPGSLVMVSKLSENQAYVILPTGALNPNYSLF